MQVCKCHLQVCKWRPSVQAHLQACKCHLQVCKGLLEVRSTFTCKCASATCKCASGGQACKRQPKRPSALASVQVRLQAGPSGPKRDQAPPSATKRAQARPSAALPSGRFFACKRPSALFRLQAHLEVESTLKLHPVVIVCCCDGGHGSFDGAAGASGHLGGRGVRPYHPACWWPQGGVALAGPYHRSHHHEDVAAGRRSCVASSDGAMRALPLSPPLPPPPPDQLTLA